MIIPEATPASVAKNKSRVTSISTCSVPSEFVPTTHFNPSSGRTLSMIKYEATNIIPAAPKCPLFRALCGFPPSCVLTRKVPIIDTKIPAAASVNGSCTKSG